MKGWVWALLILGVWIAYKRDTTFSNVVNRLVPTNGGTLKSPLSQGFGNSVSGASRSGSTSPGSGQSTVQPGLVSTYGVGGSGAGAGYTGVVFKQPTEPVWGPKNPFVGDFGDEQ